MTTKITCEKRTITLTFDDDFEVAQVHAALMHRQWVRLKGDTVQLADVEPEPKCSDHERLIAGAVAPCFAQSERKPSPAQVQADTGEWYSQGCYVQHIGAYMRERDYGRLYSLMVSVGFVLLRSPRGTDDNRYWEIWYLPSIALLKGPLEKADRKTLVKWLFDNVQPGNVSFNGESWSLSCG